MYLEMAKSYIPKPRYVQVDTHKIAYDAERSMTPPKPMKVSDRTFSYSERHRGQWFRPEYDFDEIQIAQDTDSYMFRAIQKKVNRVICAGMSFTGANEDSVSYIKERIAYQAIATNKPFEQLVWDTFHDLFRFSNCMWVKKRDRNRSMGNVRIDAVGNEIEPIAGYFILPFETLEFKTKANGEFKKAMQKMPDGRTKEFDPTDLIHFYTNKKPGFTVGTPELFPALDDVALLRRIEENVEDLIETNLFPVFHYQVGNDTFPERYGPDGVKESDVVKKTIEYMPAGGIYVSDHRHKIEAVGSEGRALRIDYYVGYFKNRVLASLGVSSVDMGEGDSSNRSTASTMSKGLMMDVEAMTIVVKRFIEFYVITELLLEGGYNPLDTEEMVYVKFGTIDKEDRRADENQQIQMFHGNIRTMAEVRASLGDRPFTEEDFDDTFFKKFEEPGSLSKLLSPGSAAGETLAMHPASNIDPAAIKKEKEFAEKQAKEAAKAKAAARPAASGKGKSASKTSASKARPSNQHGTRASAKTNRDFTIYDSNGLDVLITCDFDIDSTKIAEWNKLVLKRHSELNCNIALDVLARSMIWRLKEI